MAAASGRGAWVVSSGDGNTIVWFPEVSVYADSLVANAGRSVITQLPVTAASVSQYVAHRAPYISYSACAMRFHVGCAALSATAAGVREIVTATH